MPIRDCRTLWARLPGSTSSVRRTPRRSAPRHAALPINPFVVGPSSNAGFHHYWLKSLPGPPRSTGTYLEPAGGRPRCSGRGPGASSWTRYLERFSDVVDATSLIPCRLFRVAYQLVPLRGHVHDAAGVVLQRLQRNGSR
jgi:hypothetical protein